MKFAHSICVNFVIAVWNGSPSGTGQAVRYTQSKSKTITIINPFSMEITR